MIYRSTAHDLTLFSHGVTLEDTDATGTHFEHAGMIYGTDSNLTDAVICSTKVGATLKNVGIDGLECPSRTGDAGGEPPVPGGATERLMDLCESGTTGMVAASCEGLPCNSDWWLTSGGAGDHVFPGT